MDALVNNFNWELSLFLKNLEQFRLNINKVNSTTLKLLIAATSSIDEFISGIDGIRSDEEDVSLVTIDDNLFEMRSFITCRVCCIQILSSRDEYINHLSSQCHNWAVIKMKNNNDFIGTKQKDLKNSTSKATSIAFTNQLVNKNDIFNKSTMLQNVANGINGIEASVSNNNRKIMLPPNVFDENFFEIIESQSDLTKRNNHKLCEDNRNGVGLANDPTKAHYQKKNLENKVLLTGKPIVNDPKIKPSTAYDINLMYSKFSHLKGQMSSSELHPKNQARKPAFNNISLAPTNVSCYTNQMNSNSNHYKPQAINQSLKPADNNLPQISSNTKIEKVIAAESNCNQNANLNSKLKQVFDEINKKKSKDELTAMLANNLSRNPSMCSLPTTSKNPKPINEFERNHRRQTPLSPLRVRSLSSVNTPGSRQGTIKNSNLNHSANVSKQPKKNNCFRNISEYQ